MDTKWPFIAITFAMLFGLGLTIGTLQKKSVMKNWDKRRCNLPVVAAASFFKPENDPRTSSQFAFDNFNFCMKDSVDKFMEVLMSPLQAVFGKHMGLASSASDMVGTLRNISSTMYNALLGSLDSYFRRFTAGIYEMSRIVQYLRMAMRRVNAMMVGFLYSGLTMFRGMINTIQFVIKVILIICGILLAIIIILIFILFPFIPMILTVLGAIVSVVLIFTMSLAGVIDGAVGGTAQSDKNGFCFSEGTLVCIKTETGEEYIPVEQIKIGQELGNGCGEITTTIKMVGDDVDLYNVNGIYVSGSHTILGTDKKWKLVEEDERAVKSSHRSNILYCFNTTTHTIPIKTQEGQPILFRDWEELEDDDEEAHKIWDSIVLETLNGHKYTSPIHSSDNIPVVSNNTLIKTKYGYKTLFSIRLKDKIIDCNGNIQTVLGIINTHIIGKEESFWKTDLYEFDTIWKKSASTVKEGTNVLQGRTLITTTGSYIIYDENTKKDILVRDFTDIGYDRIHETYPFVSQRLSRF
jgi:hypothetical protein